MILLAGGTHQLVQQCKQWQLSFPGSSVVLSVMKLCLTNGFTCWLIFQLLNNYGTHHCLLLRLRLNRTGFRIWELKWILEIFWSSSFLGGFHYKKKYYCRCLLIVVLVMVLLRVPQWLRTLFPLSRNHWGSILALFMLAH